jgi:hypothetical protein
MFKEIEEKEFVTLQRGVCTAHIFEIIDLYLP